MNIRRIEVINLGHFFVAEDSSSVIIFENKRFPFNSHSEEYVSAIAETNHKDVYVDFLIGSDSHDLKIYKLIDTSFNLEECPLKTLPSKALDLLEAYYKEGVTLNYPKFLDSIFNTKRSNMLASLSLMKQVV